MVLKRAVKSAAVVLLLLLLGSVDGGLPRAGGGGGEGWWGVVEGGAIEGGGAIDCGGGGDGSVDAGGTLSAGRDWWLAGLGELLAERREETDCGGREEGLWLKWIVCCDGCCWCRESLLLGLERQSEARLRRSCEKEGVTYLGVTEPCRLPVIMGVGWLRTLLPGDASLADPGCGW